MGAKDYSKFVGISYKELNCWDLAVKFYYEILGIDLRNFYSGPVPDRVSTKNLIYTNIGEFERVERPEFGDIILMKFRGIESHIAIYVGGGKFLHSTVVSGSVIDRVSRWHLLVVGYYRVKPEVKGK